MLNRRILAAALIIAAAFPTLAAAQATTPSAAQIERKLGAAPRVKLRRDQRVTVRELKRRPEMRRIAPSIDIQSINFTFGSAEISCSQYGKVENIATAMERILRRDRREVFLIEGHTDAVGSFAGFCRKSAPRLCAVYWSPNSAFLAARWRLSAMARNSCWFRPSTRTGATLRDALRRVTDVIEPL